MSTHCDLLRELVDRFNRRQPIDVTRYFTPSFRLNQPGGRDRAGLSGAQEMIDAMYALGEQVQLNMLAAVEQGDHVAVRWQFDGMRDGVSSAGIAMYRFEAGRIADDWGVAAGMPWRDC